MTNIYMKRIKAGKTDPKEARRKAQEKYRSKRKQINITVPLDYYNNIQDWMTNNGVYYSSVAELVRKALDEYMYYHKDD